MRRDMLSEMEDLTGKHWSEFSKGEQAVAILAHVAEGRRVTEAYRSMGDTHNEITWDAFKALIQAYGFTIHLTDTFTPPSWGGEERQEELIIAHHEAKGLLLCATSYSWTPDAPKVNGGNVYAEVSIPDGMSWQDASRVLGSYSGGCITPKGVTPIRYEVYYDVREGLLSKLERIELGGLTFCPTWTRQERPRSVWLVDYAQERESEHHADKYQNGGFFDRCREERIARLPESVRQAIGR